MSDADMLTTLDGQMLTAAFPTTCGAAATTAGGDAAARLFPRQWTERFAVQVEGEQVLIPARLHFTSEEPALPEGGEAWRLARAIQTRSNDGFQRQRALRACLSRPEPWIAPFVVALVGEYIVEILEDVQAAMTPELEQILTTFIAHNRPFWETTKRRVASYWTAYYRYGRSGGTRQTYARKHYVGFELVDRMDAVAHR